MLSKKQELISLLTDPVLQEVNFICMNCWISGKDYGIIANKVKNGHIKVNFHSFTGFGGKNVYNSMWNTLILHKSLFDSEYGKAMVVHEATHAIQDMKRQSLTVGNSEVAAYIAAYIYLLKKGKSPSPSSFFVDHTFKIATAIANKKIWRVSHEDFYKAKKLLSGIEVDFGNNKTRPYKNINYQTYFDGN